MASRELNSSNGPKTFLLAACLLVGGWAASAVLAGPDCNDPKHQDRPACSGGGSGDAGALYDLEIGGDLTGSGTDWVLDNETIKHLSDGRFATGGTGTIDLGYFVLNPIFSAPRASNCFGDGAGVNIQAAHLEQRKTGGAAAFIWFDAQTDDGAVTVRYRLEMWGYFDDPADWPPASANTMNFPTWKLRLEGPDRSKYGNVACLGDGEFSGGTYIDLTRTN